eukprot:985350-Prymnesium_polylepis.1
MSLGCGYPVMLMRSHRSGTLATAWFNCRWRRGAVCLFQRVDTSSEVSRKDVITCRSVPSGVLALSKNGMRAHARLFCVRFVSGTLFLKQNLFLCQMTTDRAIRLLQAVARDRAVRWRTRSPFYRAAIRAGFH